MGFIGTRPHGLQFMIVRLLSCQLEKDRKLFLVPPCWYSSSALVDETKRGHFGNTPPSNKSSCPMKAAAVQKPYLKSKYKSLML